MCGCGGSHVKVNALNADPTRTTTLRKRFEAEFKKRYAAVIRELREYTSQAPEIMVNRDYEFKVGPLSVGAVLDFVNESLNRNVIDPKHAKAIIDERGIQPTPGNWIEEYMYESYERGVRRAENEINKKRPEDRKVDLMKGAIKRQNHKDRLQNILGRVYTSLEGIDEAAQSAIRTEIAAGLEAGEGTSKIAKRIEDRVDKIGRTRSKTLARTEVIRAHHSANMASYREAGVLSVRVTAELLTAGDGRVCPECSALADKEYTLDEIEDMIPVHPNCRCVALPDAGV